QALTENSVSSSHLFRDLFRGSPESTAPRPQPCSDSWILGTSPGMTPRCRFLTREGLVRVLLTGATGLIGSAVLAALRGEGHEVVAIVRSAASAGRLSGATRCVALDIGRAAEPADWLPHLAGIGAGGNCAGVLQDSPRD